jgi:5'-nucleotidase
LKTILLTNDDGFDASGIIAVREVLEKFGRVVTVAPAHQKSASAHSLTLKAPLKVVEVEKDIFKVDDGTPSDCVYLSKNAIFKDLKPDLVVSGINEGANLGEDITYSGTVAGAMEGVLQGVPSIAISQVIGKGGDWNNIDYTLAKEITERVVKKIFSGGIPIGERELLNINIPPKGDGKPEITFSGYRIYGSDFKRCDSPRGETHFWLGLHPLQWEVKDEKKVAGFRSDFEAIADGKTSITPVKLDLTAYERMKNLSSWLEDS